MEQITLNMIPKGITPMCHASQYDKGRHIRLNIMDGLQGYKLTDETAEIRVRKPDNNIVTAGVNVVSGASYVDIVTTEQMTACEGENLCEIVITKGDVKIASLNFKMKVEVDPLKDGIESETEIHNLETQIAEIDARIVPPIVAEEVSNQYDSENVIFDDTPTASHGTGYTVTSEGIKNYVDNKPNALVDLTDVDIDNPTSNQALVWDTTEQKWINGEVSTVGGLNDLNDVTIDDTSLADKQELVYNGTAEVFENKTTRVELTQAEYDALANPLPDVDYYITDAPSMQGTSADLSYDGDTDSVYDVVEEVKGDVGDLSQLTTTDKSSLVGAINEIASYTPVYGNTASGTIATFDTSLALPLQDCTIAINAVQESGTPTSSSPKAISGFTGANIKVAGNLLNGNKVQVGDRTVRLGELAGNTYSTHLLATTYTISFTRPTNKAFRFDLIDSNNTVTTLIPFPSTNNSVTFNITTEGDYCFSIYLYGGVVPSDIDNVMLVGGSEVKPYTAYTEPTTTAISWQSEVGTVYGGSLKIANGYTKLVDNGNDIDLGTLTWTKNTSFANTLFVANITGKKTNNSNCLCTHYVNGGIATGTTFLNNLANNNFASDTANGIYIRDDSKASLSADDFKTAMSGVTLKYEVATPTEYTLASTPPISAIVGTNNVFTDTNGDTSVVFACSLKDYIEGQ